MIRLLHLSDAHLGAAYSGFEPVAEARRAEVLEAYNADLLETKRQLVAAATVLSSSNRPADLLLASELATVAAMRGDQAAAKLFALCWDRYCDKTNLPIRYGLIPGSRRSVGISPAFIAHAGL